ncbi:MAG: CoF synthetase [Planctomycetota bacterium]|nr:MAG: CoF synthetase [Planctomycetota bacterium]
MTQSALQRRGYERLDRHALQALQLDRLNALLARILPANRFYAEKLRGVRLPLESFEQFRELPLTAKDEISPTTGGEGGEGGGPALPANLTWPLEQYVRFHQTSGTHGRPLAVYDTAEDWQWWVDCWQYVLDAAEVTQRDRAMLAFSFGPFIGFWSAHEALAARGALIVPGGGMDSRARLEMIERTGATALFCTPTYALRLAEVAAERHIDLRRLPVKSIVVAGEPGGSVPSIRQRIESAWNARLVDHAGASEVGAWGYADRQRRGLHVIESEFIAEFISIAHGGPAAAGELAQLVLTSLGRHGMPAIRYRTGDLVRPAWRDDADNNFVLLDGGVLGRADDMLIVRGVNVFPSAVEQILYGFPEVVEYRLIIRSRGAMDELSLEVEDRLGDPRRIADELYLRLGLRVDVRLAPPSSLPRFEGKARRLVDERDTAIQ